MTAPSTLAEIRFGFGLSPRDAAPDGPQALLDSLRGFDEAQTFFPLRDMNRLRRVAQREAQLRGASSRGEDPAARGAYVAFRRTQLAEVARDSVHLMARAIYGTGGFRERLMHFWADHFTVTTLGAPWSGLPLIHADQAVRPHIAGRFEDLLISAVLHPAMLMYLDQIYSIGPNSPRAQARREAGRQTGRGGMNENLAREILELHTLGVGQGYSQADVTELARLLTGITFHMSTGVRFSAERAEPGPKEVLGRTYGAGTPPGPAVIHAALRDLARHPLTARHLCRKLAVHFIAPEPPEDMIADMVAAYEASGGELRAVYAALLAHPAAWGALGAKAKRPYEFIVSALRALRPDPAWLRRRSFDDLAQIANIPLMMMGQPVFRAPGPDGWDESWEAWITPGGMAGRIQWALQVPQTLTLTAPAPPQEVLKTALADLARPETRFAVAAAEDQWSALGMIFAAPEFNWR